MIPDYDAELDRTLKEKKFNYSEVYSMIEHLHKRSKRTKYITLLLVSLWAPAITLLLWVHFQHPLAYIFGSVSSTFAIYVFDETYESVCNHLIGKMRKKDEQQRKNKRNKEKD